MAIKKVKMTKEEIDKILDDKIEIYYSKEVKERNVEDDVDEAVKKKLGKKFGMKNVVRKKTGLSTIDKSFPPYHGDNGHGKPDIIVFNCFNEQGIDLLIEDKNFTSKDNALQQVITYAGINKVLKQPCRVVIANSPSQKLEIRVMVKQKWLPLKINGEKIDYFFGKEILRLIYNNPDYNEFVLEEVIEKPFTQKEFKTIMGAIEKIYRQVPEVQKDDDLRINFTVAFIALKMIIEKQGGKWELLTTPKDIENEVLKIDGDMAERHLQDKYIDIFRIKNKQGLDNFNFYQTLHEINVRENRSGIQTNNSVLMMIKNILEGIPKGDLNIDLFGEVYESLATKKTKSALGEFFTPRHIIQAMVRIFFEEKEIQDIVEHKKLIADPCCGTGGFLTEAFKYIKKYCEEKHPQLNLSNLANEIIIGYDIKNHNIGRTRINMTLAGDGFSDIEPYNTLTSPKIKENIDFILTNIPYGAGNDIISDPNSKDIFLKSNKNKRLELNFMIKIIQILKPGGRALIIMPEGLLDAPSLSSFREYFLKQCKIETIISLPKYSFAPYTKWKTYVLFVEKRSRPLDDLESNILKSEKVYGYIVDNDGFANSDKRFETDLRDENNAFLHNELTEYIDITGKQHMSKIQEIYMLKNEDCKELYTDEWGNKIYGKKYGYIGMSTILERKINKFKNLTSKEVNIRLREEANSQNILSEESHKILISNISMSHKGYSVKKDNYIENDVLKEDWVSIFEEMKIQYDPNENKYYDNDAEETTYELSLIPEKYLRKKIAKLISLEELQKAVYDIECDLKTIGMR